MWDCGGDGGGGGGGLCDTSYQMASTHSAHELVDPRGVPFPALAGPKVGLALVNGLQLRGAELQHRGHDWDEPVTAPVDGNRDDGWGGGGAGAAAFPNRN